MARSACAMTLMTDSSRSRGQAACPTPLDVTLRSSDSGVIFGGCPGACQTACDCLYQDPCICLIYSPVAQQDKPAEDIDAILSPGTRTELQALRSGLLGLRGPPQCASAHPPAPASRWLPPGPACGCGYHCESWPPQAPLQHFDSSCEHSNFIVVSWLVFCGTVTPSRLGADCRRDNDLTSCTSSRANKRGRVRLHCHGQPLANHANECDLDGSLPLRHVHRAAEHDTEKSVTGSEHFNTRWLQHTCVPLERLLPRASVSLCESRTCRPKAASSKHFSPLLPGDS